MYTTLTLMLSGRVRVTSVLEAAASTGAAWSLYPKLAGPPPAGQARMAVAASFRTLPGPEPSVPTQKNASGPAVALKLATKFWFHNHNIGQKAHSPLSLHRFYNK